MNNPYLDGMDTQRNLESYFYIVFVSASFTSINLILFDWYTGSIMGFISKVLLVFVANIFWWLSISWNSILFKSILILFLFYYIGLFYACIALKVSPFINPIELIFQTDIHEISEQLSVWLIFPILLWIFCVYRILWKMPFKMTWRISVLAILLIFLFTNSGYLRDFRKKYGTFLLGESIPLMLYDDLASVYRWNKIHNVGENFSDNFSLQDKAEDLLVVLIIGESARYDRFHINGYQNNTSPHLDLNQNAVSLHRYYALDTSTKRTMPYIFMRSHNRRILDSFDKNFVAVLRRLGFRASFISSQSERGGVSELLYDFDEIKTGSNYRKHHNIFGGLYDEVILDDAKEIINRHGRRLLVLHTMGSHMKYVERVPKKFDKGKLNHYDATIKYTDHFIHNIIEMVKDKRAILFYTSDHGESLSGDKYRGHAHPYSMAVKHAREQIHIPGFWYFTESYLASSENTGKLESIKKNSQKHMDQSYVYHSILGCVGVVSDVIDSKKNMCNGYLIGS